MSKAKQNKPFVRVTLIAFALSSLLLFTSLDNKFFDLFLRFLPSLTENEKVFVLALDDDSMERAGGFPFKREVMGDIVILLKELGVETIAFDLSYLDESAARYDADYASVVFDEYLFPGIDAINRAAMSAVDNVQPNTTLQEREIIKRGIRNATAETGGDFRNAIYNLGRDVDEYFAQALAFTGNSFLTLSFISKDLLIFDDDAEFQTDAEIDRYLAENIASVKVESRKDGKTPEMVGVFPAIQKLMTRVQGAGFVNAGPDIDGLRRRVNLLLKYQDNYYTQLTLRSLQEKLGYTSIEVSNRTIMLKNENEEILRIPRAQDGTVLLKWAKKSFYDYNMMSLRDLIQHTLIEASLVHNIIEMEEWGFFFYSDEDYNPWDYYFIEREIRNEAFANNSAAGEEWVNARQDFYDSCERFLFGPYHDYIMEDVDDPALAEFVNQLFDASRAQYTRMKDIRTAAAGLANSWVVIGSDATSMTDNGLITFQENYPNVGSYAVMANMMLSGEFVDDAPWFIPLIIALLFSLLIGFFVSHYDTHISIIIGISGLIVLSAFFVSFFLITKVYIGFSVPLISTTLTFVSIMVIKFLTASKEKAFIHNAFSKYLAPEVITDIINNPDKLNLGGEKRVMTAIFTDIRGFSTISEKLDPQQLVRLLNLYLTKMSNIIMENRGTIDKYEGDAIIAFFGAPLFTEDHAILAVRSAIAMKDAEIEFNKLIEEEKLSPMPVFTRIGINTGDMVVGNMGAENKMDYTIMGNAVNLAARLEGVNKQYNTGGILTSEYTRDKIGDEFLIRRLDRVRVVGINTPVRLFEILQNKAAASQDQIAAVEKWESALDMFESKQFSGAMEVFNSLYQANSRDGVAELYIKRCETFIKEPPPQDWDAVKNLTEK